MSDNTKLILVTTIAVVGTLGVLFVLDSRSKSGNDLAQEVPPVEKPVAENIGDLLEEKNFESARELLSENEDTLTESQYEIQENRIDLLESYTEFYGSNDPNARIGMINQAKTAIDNFFTTIASPDTNDFEKGATYLAVGFSYSETWSDEALLEHIATKLGVEYSSPATPRKQAEILNQLFTLAVDNYPVQDSYIKRAWVNSRLLLTETFANDQAARASVVASVQSDLEQSAIRSGFKFTSSSRYYNAYIALAYGDILDALYQEGEIEGYGEVDYAYRQALNLANEDFFGNRIIQDIVRMNYAASLYRAEGFPTDNERIVEILSPVADNVRAFTADVSLNYEGILVMLRDIPVFQNQTNASIYSIFKTYSQFSDIPGLLKWNDAPEPPSYVFKMI